MVHRRGLGRGKGRGYYNLAPRDSYVHSLSARGYKTGFIRAGQIANAGRDVVIVKEDKKRDLINIRLVDDNILTYEKDEVNIYAKGSTTLVKELTSKFTAEQIRALKLLNYDLESGIWSLQWTKKPSEIFVLETQLGITTSQARKLAKEYLDVLDKYPSKEGLKFMEYDHVFDAKGSESVIRNGDVVAFAETKNVSGETRKDLIKIPEQKFDKLEKAGLTEWKKGLQIDGVNLSAKGKKSLYGKSYTIKWQVGRTYTFDKVFHLGYYSTSNKTEAEKQAQNFKDARIRSDRGQYVVFVPYGGNMVDPKFKENLIKYKTNYKKLFG